jgi:trk system potassium uptake protein TrkA
MNILIVGCGKVGSSLAATLCREGHDVSILDRDERAFELLPDDYTGYITTGVPIDQDVLHQAGIENCDAVAAVSSDDNVNIMVCQLAKEFFHVKTVVARIYDPKRENVFSHFGLQTICPTNISVDAIRSALLGQRPQTLSFASHSVSFQTIRVPKHLVGVRVSEIQNEQETSIFAVLHSDLSLTLAGSEEIVLTPDDQLIIAKLVD